MFRIIESLGWKRSLDVFWFQPACNEQVPLPLDQVAQSLTQADLECFQRWAICHPSRQPVLVCCQPHLKKKNIPFV